MHLSTQTCQQKTAVVSFVPPSFVCVAWQGLQDEDPEVISLATSIAHGSGGSTEFSSGTISTTTGQEKITTLKGRIPENICRQRQKN